MFRIGFFIFFLITLLGDFIANEKPLYVNMDNKIFFPAFRQKLIDLGLDKTDSIFFHKDWNTAHYQSILKAPIPFSGNQIIKNAPLSAPPLSPNHILGTDKLGRDVAAGIIQGTQTAFIIGIGTTLLAVLLGVFMGSIAGFWGRWIDFLVMRIIEIKNTIPSLFWVLSIAAVINKCTILQIILILGGLMWTNIALLMRSSVGKIKTEDYVVAAKTIGLSPSLILLKHIIPNSLYPIYVAAAHLVAVSILAESSLSFLGIGLPIEEVTWGTLLRQGQDDLSSWWLVVFPGFCLFIIIILFNGWSERLRNNKQI